MRKLVVSLAVLTCAAAVPMAFATAAGASTTRVVHPGESIQAAVDASAAGDTVIVQSGTYAQTVGIHTSGIKLVGRGAVLVPPKTAEGFDCLDGSAFDGICIFPRHPRKDPPLDGVTVQGMTVKNFGASGIFAFNETNLTYNRNTAINNEEYGLAAFSTVGTRMTHNTAVGAHEADFYLGDSPGANGLIRSNVAHNATGWGVFVRNSQGVTVQDNDIRGNCVGLLVLADAPGPSGNVTARHNTILANNNVCPAGQGPPLSGIGVALVGANDTKIQSNVISGNVPAGPTAFQGGVVIASGLSGTPPTNNLISKNVIHQNSPDVASDGSGSGNVVKNNQCGADPGICT
jgi:parallel beta-helix repeat protein